MGVEDIKKIRNVEEQPGYFTWKDNDELAAKLVSTAAHYSTSDKATAGTFDDILPGISVTEDFTRMDYEFFRPDEALPRSQIEAIRKCANVYDEVEIAHTIIDLISDFAYQGIRIVNVSKRAQKDCDMWWKKIEGEDVSERFTNYVLQYGNIVVTRETAIASPEETRKALRADADEFSDEDETPEIPWKYWLYTPLEVEPIAPDIARYSKNRIFGLRITAGMIKAMKKTNPTVQEQKLIAGVPAFIRNAKISTARNLVLLPEDKTRSFHYKRKGNRIWADPIVKSMLDTFSLLKKTKLADTRALDGSISRITHWKVGNLEYKIAPNPTTIEQLANTLQAGANNGSAINVVTGPEVEFTESKSNFADILKNEKYVNTLNSIYAGFGIPPILIGSGNSPGMSNNFISVKALLKRIKYLRDMLIRFWEEELKQFQLAMGHKKRSQIYFDHMSLTDEDAEKALLIQLVDRKILSADTLLEAFGKNNDIEEIKMARQKSVPERDQPVSALAGAQRNLELEKIALQAGDTTLSEHGVELVERKSGEKSRMELNVQMNKEKPTPAGAPTTKKKGVPGQGRPKKSNDTKKRKQRIPKASLDIPNDQKFLELVAQYKTYANKDELDDFDLRVITSVYDQFKEKDEGE